jgi:antitoxin CcdA
MVGYDTAAPKRPVNMTLNEDLVRKARELTGNLSEQVEMLLSAYVLAEQRRRADEEGRLDAMLDALRRFTAKHGSFADEHTTL